MDYRLQNTGEMFDIKKDWKNSLSIIIKVAEESLGKRKRRRRRTYLKMG